MKFNKNFLFLFLIAAVGVGVWYGFLKPKGPTYKTMAVVRGDIKQEISETGAIKKGETINLNFKNSGTIDEVKVEKGDVVKAGQVLAQLDTAQLGVQLKQAQANLELYRVQRDKLVNGAAAEDINLAQTVINNTRILRDNAKQGLEDARQNAQQELVSLYDAAKDELNSAHSKAVNASNEASLIQRTYFDPQSDDSINVTEMVREIANAADKIKDSGDYDADLKEAVIQLAKINNDLALIRDICEKKAWQDIVEQTDKDDIDAQRGYIIAAQTAVNTAKQGIDLQKVANDAAINTAQAALAAAEGNLQSSQEQLTKLTAQARPEDVGVLEAQMKQAQAAIDLLKLQIGDSKIVAPVSGQIAQVNYREGEAYMAAMANAGAIVLIPEDPFFAEVDIYEEDVNKITIGNTVKITPASSLDKSYDGRVAAIDPDSKIINGVVYYTTKISFDVVPQDIKPGMSADVVILAASAKDVFLVPEAALGKDGNDYFVKRLDNGVISNIEVNVGIKSKGQVQIISGVSEGDLLVIE